MMVVPPRGQPSPRPAAVRTRPRDRPRRCGPPESRARSREDAHGPRPSHRPGHDLEPGDRLRRAPGARRQRRRRSSRSTSRSRAGSSTTPTTSGRRPPPSAAPRSSAPASRPARHRRDRHHQPARDDAGLGPRDRPAARARHRLAGPPHRRRSAPSCAPPATRRWSPSAPGCCSTPTSPAPSSSGCSTPTTGARERARRGELLFGTVDSWLIWKLTGGRVARHRRHQRRADAALQHPRRRLGPRHLRAPRRADGDAAGGARLRRRLRRDPRRPLRPARSRSSASPATSRRRRSARPASRPAC